MKDIKPISLHIAYIAGVFDGEGTVGLYAYKHTLPSPVLAISGSCIEMLKAIQNYFGFGIIFGYDPGSFQPETKRHKPMYRWQLRKWSEIITVLESVRPYLIEKAKQADLVLEASKLRPGKGKRMTKESKVKFYALADDVKQAKKITGPIIASTIAPATHKELI